MEWPVDGQYYHCIVSAWFGVCVCVWIWARAHVTLSVCTRVRMCPCTHTAKDALNTFSIPVSCLCLHMRSSVCYWDNRPFVARGATVTLFSKELSDFKSLWCEDKATASSLWRLATWNKRLFGFHISCGVRWRKKKRKSSVKISLFYKLLWACLKECRLNIS